MPLQFNHISTKNGLVSTYARKILQDPFGFFWIATQDGLSRYAGVGFVNYTASSRTKQHTITGSDVRDILLDTSNALIWAISSYGGIDAINYITGNVTFSLKESNNDLIKNVLYNSLSILDSTLFIGCSNGLISLNTGTKKIINRFSFPVEEKGPTMVSVNKIFLDVFKNIWLFCNNYGIILLSSKKLSIIASAKKEILISSTIEKQLYFFDCCVKDDGVIVGTSLGIKYCQLSNGEIKIDNHPYPFIEELATGEVFACAVDIKKDIWLATNKYLLKISPLSKKYQFVTESTSKDELKWVNSVFSIFFDTKNNLWLGCQQGFMYAKNSNVIFESFFKSRKQDVSINQVYYIYPFNDSIVYVCATDGFYKVNTITKGIDEIDRDKIFFYTFMDPFNRLWVSNNEGTYIFQKGSNSNISDIYKEFNSIGKVTFNSHIQIGDSVIVLGTENEKGVLTWNFKKNTIRIINQNSSKLFLKEDVINNLFRDQNGNVWVLGDYSISILDFRVNKTISLDVYNHMTQKNNSIFFDACYSRGNYYVATYGGGVLEYNSNYTLIEQTSTENGLANNEVYKIIPYSDSILLISTNNGLSKLNLITRTIKNYYNYDGLQSDNFEERAGSASQKYIYAGGVNGFTIIDPKYFTTNPVPPTFYFTNIKTQTTSSTQDTSNLEIKELKIPSNWLQTDVSFVGLNYSNPDRVTYEYRIKERSDKWSEPSTKNDIPLIGLPPGTYTLEVKAANEDGVWCEPKTLTLIFLPKWYQTIWFDIAIALAITGILYAFYRYRIGQLKKQQEIRIGIANDLHDDIGSALNTVKVFTHLAKRDTEKEGHLNQIEESLTQATVGLRDMLWILDDTQDTLQEIMERIKKFALPVATAHGINLDCATETTEGENRVNKTKKRNLLLIAKESINNSIKYAQCQNIQVLLQQKKNKITLVIKDDGVGFDTAVSANGYGLKNIQHRAAQINCTAEITSVKGEGTIIKIMSK